MGLAFDRGNILYQQRRYDLALREFEAELAQAPERADVLAALSLCHKNLKHYVRARAIAEDAIRADPAFAWGHYALGWAIYSDGKFSCARDGDWPADRVRRSPQHRLSLAAAAAAEALHLCPRNEDALLLCAYVAFDDYYPLRALELADAGLAINPDSAPCQRMRARVLRAFGDVQGAHNASAAALASQPESASTISSAGWTEMARGNYDHAKTYFADALRINPESEVARDGLQAAMLTRYVMCRWIRRFRFSVQTYWQNHRYDYGFGGIAPGLRFAVWVFSWVESFHAYLLLFDPFARNLFSPSERLVIAFRLGIVFGLIVLLVIESLLMELSRISFDGILWLSMCGFAAVQVVAYLPLLARIRGQRIDSTDTEPGRK